MELYWQPNSLCLSTINLAFFLVILIAFDVFVIIKFLLLFNAIKILYPWTKCFTICIFFIYSYSFNLLIHFNIFSLLNKLKIQIYCINEWLQCVTVFIFNLAAKYISETVSFSYNILRWHDGLRRDEAHEQIFTQCEWFQNYYLAVYHFYLYAIHASLQ